MNNDPISLFPFSCAVLCILILMWCGLKRRRWPEMEDYFSASAVGLGLAGGLVAIAATFIPYIHNALADTSAYLFFGGVASFAVAMNCLKRLVKAHVLNDGKQKEEKEHA